MATSPLARALVGDRRDVERVTIKPLALALRKLPGSFIVAEAMGEVIGAARVVRWPQCQMSWRQAFLLAPTVLSTIGLSAWKGISVKRAFSRLDPDVPHLHLDPFAVIPEHHGLGVATRLLRHVCSAADLAGEAVFHETDQKRSLPFYRHFEFKVTGAQRLLNVETWSLLRGARAARGQNGREQA